MDNIAMARQRLQGLYLSLDEMIRESLTQETVSCKRGCCACCRITVCTAFLEGIVIADHVLGLPREQRIAVTQRLRLAAPPLGETSDEWALRGIDCGFLDPATKDCLIYEQRPAACRYHFVVSPPENCVPGPPRQIEMLDTVDLEGIVHQTSKTAMGQILLAPLPSMVLHCMVLLDPTKRKAALDISAPVDWTRLYVADLHKDTVDGSWI